METAFLAGSSEADWSTAMKLGRMAVMRFRIMFTITLYSGRRCPMMDISVMPSSAPKGWLLTVMNAPSGSLSSTSRPSMRVVMRKSFRSDCVNGTPGVSKKRSCTSFTRSI